MTIPYAEAIKDLPHIVEDTRSLVRTPAISIPGSLGRTSLSSPIFIVAAPRSGSTLLFETLSQSNQLATLGDEAHGLVEDIRSLRPGGGKVTTNRLTADDASDAVGRRIKEEIFSKLQDRSGRPVGPEESLIFLEKTPKNALRIPFFNHIFLHARFVFLWRDPRENISSMMEAWRSGRFVTYRNLEGFHGPWSLLLPPGYPSMSGKSLQQIAAYQWSITNRTVLDDLSRLRSDRWVSLEYAAFVRNPHREIARLCAALELEVDSFLETRVSGVLPPSRSTQTAPAPKKWLKNEAQIEEVLPSTQSIWDRLLALEQAT